MSVFILINNILELNYVRDPKRISLKLDINIYRNILVHQIDTPFKRRVQASYIINMGTLGGVVYC